MTTAFCEVLKQMRGRVSYSDLINQLTDTMKKRKFSQRPQLTTSQKFPFDRAFSLTDVAMNSNPELGRKVRKKFKPNPLAGPASTAGELGRLLQEAGLSPGMADMGGKLLVAAMGALFK
ncbi:unnamed protein product [Prorocentrum cordatum]|uniref:Uncharacterized protein n=1 Tax=Prorocentrum cordatum TaxID=2364126 RepID=A0ABN9XYC1_9DINO|nr:unnamed protein product [Polarella glacialis]